MARSYYSPGAASAAFYDLVTAADRSLDGDVDFYAALTPAGGSVLELGSGTGRVSSALARLGFEVTGLEIAPAMLEQAKATAGGRGPSYVRGDMTSISLGRKFDSVICPFYALAHLPPGAAWRNTFRGVARHLEPKGLAAFHLPAGDKMALPSPPTGALLLSELAKDGRRLEMRLKSQVYRADIGRLDLTLNYILSGEDASSERLTLYNGDPRPYAATAGLIPDREPVPLGSTGSIHVFRLSE
jgi:SAM-dependent methyltransferase